MRKLLTLFLFFSIFSNAQDYQKQWTDIEDLEKKELSTDKFYIDKKEAFGSINSFISHKFKRVNPTLLLYQEILNSYKKDKKTQELYHANLKRLKFVYKHFRPQNRDKYYIKALNSLETQQMNSEALYYLADYYFDKLEYKKALSYAKKGIKNSNIREKCQNIIDNIKSEYIDMDIEKINLPNKNILTKITYKNIHNISIKVFQPLTKKTIRDFNISLPLTNDYKKHSTEISLGSYNLGEYIVIISNGENITYSSITISNLAYFYKNSEILIINRESGKPIKGTKILFYKDDKKSLITTIESDKNGLVQIPQTLNKYYIEIKYGKDRLKVQDIIKYMKIDKSKKKSKEKIYFFSDKNIYKSDDNIEFKGIIVKQFLDKKPKVIPNKKIKITLSNNNKKIKSKIFKSDEFGSIYGLFHIPKYTIGEIKLVSKLGNKSLVIQKNILDRNNTTKKITKDINKTINISIDEKLDKNSAKIIKINSTKTIRGKIVVEKLKPRNRVYRKRYWNIPDKLLYNQKEFKKLFPNYLYNQNRTKEIVKTIPFNTKKSKEILLEGLEQGEYRLTLYSTNKYGTKIEQIKNIIIYDIHQTKPPYQTYLWHKLNKNSYCVGSTATLYLKSSIPHTKVLFNLIQDNKTLKEEWIDINGSTQKLIPIKKEYRGDIFYTLTLMKNSRKYMESGVIQVPWDNKLKVEYISFRDKIDINNTQEKWKIKVTNQKGEKVDAQMLATMYKLSYDSIQHHFNIGNLYPKHNIGKYTIWKSYKIKQNEIKTKLKDSLDNRSFFIPNLQTDKDGNIIIDLKNNHQIGHQNFLGFIHTKDLKTAITQKELIVKGNKPKSFRKNIKPISHQKVITKNKILYIKPKEKKIFIFKELKDSNKSQKNYKLTIEFTSNPSWFALQAMPYILNYPNNSSQEIFHKYFITQIAYKLIKISPEVEEIFKNWKSQQDKEVVKIFNMKKLIENKNIYYNKLENLQNSDGGWSSTKKNKSDWNTTQYIANGFAKLKEISIDKTDTKMMSLAIKYMDNQIMKEYQKVKNNNRLDKDNLNHLIIDYLYIRTFYDFPILSKEAYRYYLNQSKKYWKNKTLYEQVTIALVLNKKLAKREAIDIVKSIKNKPITYNQPNIETHTKIMKLFDTINKDKKLVEFMKIWLLKNRQNGQWNTTKATASAIYTLLWDNAWVVNRSKLVDIKFPNSSINYRNTLQKAKDNIQKGIGYFQVSFDKFDRNMAIVEISNPNNNVVWGVFSWRYRDMKSKINKF